MSLSEQHIAALVLLQTLAEHTRTCRDGPLCTRAPALLKRLDVYTRYAFTTRARKRFFRFAIDVLAESHPAGAEVGRSIVARLLPS
jgi:hypothetical protein